MASEGFFVSTDGGVSYTSGFDSQGNAVVNVLSAIGITFDWAKGGILTLGGNNNVNGEINIVNNNSKVIGIHNYYDKATHISIDCNRIAYRVKKVMKNRFGKYLRKKNSF